MKFRMYFQILEFCIFFFTLVQIFWSVLHSRKIEKNYFFCFFLAHFFLHFDGVTPSGRQFFCIITFHLFSLYITFSFFCWTKFKLLFCHSSCVSITHMCKILLNFSKCRKNYFAITLFLLNYNYAQTKS